VRWFAEVRDRAEPLADGAWTRIPPRAYKTQEQAKAECKKHLETTPDKRGHLEFRILRESDHTIEQVSCPPHGWRLKWLNA